MIEERTQQGAWIALFGALFGIIGFLILFVSEWHTMWYAKASMDRPDESFIVTYIIPTLNDIGLIGSVVLAVAAFGFFKKQSWAWGVAMLGLVLMIQGSFFPMIPAASAGVAPWYGILYVPIMVLYFVMAMYVRNLSGKLVGLSLLGGMAYVLTFMNGIAATNRIWMSIQDYGLGNPVYVVAERLNWYAAIAWGVFVVALFLQQKWAVPVGIGAGIMGIIGGTPVAYLSMVDQGGFSMFIPGPALSAALLIYLLLPSGQEFVYNWAESKYEGKSVGM